MKKKKSFSKRTRILFCFLASVGLASAQEYGWYAEGDYWPTIRVRLTLANTLDFERRDCPVIIPREMMPVRSLEQTWVVVVDPSLPAQPRPSLEELKKIGSGALLEEKNGHRIPSQLDDLDKDGVWDELFFMADFKPREVKTLFVYVGKTNERGGIPHETHAGMGTYGRHLVPWWESKLMGWKLWYPDGADLYGKRRPMLVANLEGSGEISGYTAPYEYGNDIMTVSQSFGAGGICLFEDSSQSELISRPRFNPYREKGPIQATRFAYDVVVNGPLRSMIRQHVMNWRTGKGEYEFEQFYTAYKNQSYSTSRVRYLKFLPENPGVQFGVGIRKIMKEYDVFQEEGVIISFGKDLVITDPDVDPAWEKKTVVDFEAIALVVKNGYKPQYQFVRDYEGNHAFRIPLTTDLTYEYLIAAGWSEGTVNRTAKEFKDYVLRIQKEYTHPIAIKDVKLERKPD
ncbi:MAG: DUF4861 family protein [Thermodesulfobacteriota bacterium]